MSTTRLVQDNSRVVQFRYTGLTDTTALVDADGKGLVDLSDIDLNRVVIENNLTLAGSSPSVKLMAVTRLSQSEGGLASASDTPVVQGDGSTVFQCANQTTVGTTRVMQGLALKAASGATASNIGQFLGLVLVKNSGTITSATGVATVYIKG